MLDSADVKKLEEKIAALETMTSAEFKVIICAHAWFGLKRKARKLFKKYKLDRTVERNAVLLLIVEKDREFLIYGDEGIHQKVGQGFWLNVKSEMLKPLKQGDIAAGISIGLHMLADILEEHFPYKDDTNEISNHIIFEK